MIVMSNEREYKIESDSLKFLSWCMRRVIHAGTGRRFGTLELDEQVGTAIHAVLTANQPHTGPGIRIGAASCGAAWRAIRDIARNLDVTDLEISGNSPSTDREHSTERTASQVSEEHASDENDN